MRRPITPEKIKQIKDLVRRGFRTREIVLHTGVSLSTVNKVRQGRYDQRCLAGGLQSSGDAAPPRVWCPRCRCHVYAPCQVCRLRDSQRSVAWNQRKRRRRPLPAGLYDAQLIERLQLSLAELGLPLRTVNNLERIGVLTVNDLLHCQPGELLALPNFASKTLQQVYTALEQIGFRRQAS